MKEIYSIMKTLPNLDLNNLECNILCFNLSVKEIINLKLLAINLPLILSTEVNEELIKLNKKIKIKFNFNKHTMTISNIKEFIEYLNMKLLITDEKKYLDEIWKYLANKYSKEIANSIIKTDSIPNKMNIDLQEISSKILSRINKYDNLPKKIHKENFFELFILKYFCLFLISKKGEKNESYYNFISKETFNKLKNDFFSKNLKVLKFSRIPHSYKYDFINKTLDSVIKISYNINKNFPNKQIIFIARDGVIFYEAYCKIMKGNKFSSSLIYLSRDTLNLEKYKQVKEKADLFKILIKYLIKPVWDDVGYGDHNLVVKEVKKKIIYYMENNINTLSKIISQFYLIMAHYLENKIYSDEVVYFDSSSKTFPILLQAISEIAFPNKKFFSYFAVTIYKNKDAGVIVNKNDGLNSFFTDLLINDFFIDSVNSSFFPIYKPKVQYRDLVPLSYEYITNLMIHHKLG